jgi:hypothetical protein
MLSHVRTKIHVAVSNQRRNIMPITILPPGDAILKSDRDFIALAVAPRLAGKNQQVTDEVSVVMSDTFRKPVRYTAVPNNGNWDVTIHKIGTVRYISELPSPE